MCVGLALVWSDIPLALTDAHGLADRVHERGGEREVRFLWPACPTVLPVWWHGRQHVVRWGTKARRGRLPYGGWTWEETVQRGGWAHARAEPVDVPATYLFAGGVWVRVRHGCRGLLVPDPATAEPAVYLVCRPSTRYYRVMTRCQFQPVLIGEVV